MSDTPEKKSHLCPECNAELKRWQTPIDSTWGGMIKLVCFNDECPYYVNGWEEMMETQAVNASYRVTYNPKTGKISPLPVWSKSAHRDSIVD